MLILFLENEVLTTHFFGVENFLLQDAAVPKICPISIFMNISETKIHINLLNLLLVSLIL